MAIHCPVYDPITDSWHIQTMGPDGPEKKFIVSPLHYYHTMGVSPPVGAIFTDDDYLDLEDDLNNPDLMVSPYLSDSLSWNLPPLALQSSASQMNSLSTIQPNPSTSSATQSLSSSLYQPIYQHGKTEPTLATAFSPISPIVHFPPLTFNFQAPQPVGKSLNNLYGTYPIKSVHSNSSHLCDDLQEMLSDNDDYNDKYMGYGKPLTIYDLQQV